MPVLLYPPAHHAQTPAPVAIPGGLRAISVLVFDSGSWRLPTHSIPSLRMGRAVQPVRPTFLTSLQLTRRSRPTAAPLGHGEQGRMGHGPSTLALRRSTLFLRRGRGASPSATASGLYHCLSRLRAAPVCGLRSDATPRREVEASTAQVLISWVDAGRYTQLARSPSPIPARPLALPCPGLAWLHPSTRRRDEGRRGGHRRAGEMHPPDEDGVQSLVEAGQSPKYLHTCASPFRSPVSAYKHSALSSLRSEASLSSLPPDAFSLSAERVQVLPDILIHVAGSEDSRASLGLYSSRHLRHSFGTQSLGTAAAPPLTSPDSQAKRRPTVVFPAADGIPYPTRRKTAFLPRLAETCLPPASHGGHRRASGL